MVCAATVKASGTRQMSVRMKRHVCYALAPISWGIATRILMMIPSKNVRIALGTTERLKVPDSVPPTWPRTSLIADTRMQ